MRIAIVVLLLLLCLPAIPSADLVTLGDERVVATAPDGDYYFDSPDSAPLGGELVVSWTSGFTRYNSTQPIDWGGGVFGRRIAADRYRLVSRLCVATSGGADP